MKKVLIIGAAGFVGHYLIEHLKNLKTYSITATKLSNEELNFPGVNSVDLNILDEKEIINVLKNIRPDYIYHLAAQSSVSLSWDKPKLTVDVNINGTINLLNAVRSLDYKARVLLIGSGEEYGYVKPEEIPICEENILRPGNIYAATKACQNMIGKIYATAYNLDVIMVRAFNHIGPRQSDTFVVSDFCKQVAKIEKGLADPIIKVGNLEVKRDFTDVRDVVHAYELLMNFGITGEIYNVGSGEAIFIKDILDIILSKSTEKISICVDNTKFRPADIPIIEANVDQLKKITNWKPHYSLEKTIDDILNYWRKFY